eukprot:3159669-Amphidinium_carterae.1
MPAAGRPRSPDADHVARHQQISWAISDALESLLDEDVRGVSYVTVQVALICEVRAQPTIWGTA